MFIDRIIADALNFIRRFIGWQTGNKKDAPKPFQSIRSHAGDWGLISLVTGRDTPRAVRTWVYSPKRQSHKEAQSAIASAPQDLHFYLDFLGPLPNIKTARAEQERAKRQSERRRGALVPTHRVSILKASHFLNAAGVYDCEVVFWGEYDFYKPGANIDPERVAAMVLDKAVFACLKQVDPLEWEPEQWQQHIEGTLHDVKHGYTSPRLSHSVRKTPIRKDPVSKTPTRKSSIRKAPIRKRA